MENQSTKLMQLEVLRGIAALVLFLHQFFFAFVPSASGMWDDTHSVGLIGTPLYFLINGSASVIFFCVLSGFVLTYRYYLEGDQSLLTSALLKRYFRLSFPILLSILISYAFYKMGLFNYFQTAGKATQSPWLTEFAYSSHGKSADLHLNFMDGIYQAFIGCLFSNEAYFNTNLWTMRLLFIGSLMVLLIPVFVRSMKTYQLTLFFFIVAALFRSTEFYLICFVAGSLLAFFYSKNKDLYIPPFFKLFLFVMSLLLFSYYLPVGLYKFAGISYLGENQTRIVYNTIGSLFLMFILLYSKTLSARIPEKLASWMGKLAFPLYLVQALVICSVSSWFYLQLAAWGVTGAAAILLLLGFTIVAVSPLVIGLYMLESRWLNLINRISGSSTPQTPAAPKASEQT